MYKVSFVILHYENIRDTKKCIDSLEKYLLDKNVSIVVVDNGSVKEKCDDLENKYEGKNVFLLKLEKNLGFAKGNNKGYLYAKNVLKSDFIILCNNDLIFRQQNFIEKMLLEYEKDTFDVAGPKIVSLVDGMNQNPVNRELKTMSDVKKRLLKLQILFILNYLNMDAFFQSIFSKKVTEFNSNTREDYQLHGACLIMGPRYIKEFDGLYDKTFMYGEEDILRYQIDKYHLKMKYIGELEVYHKEGASTEKLYTNSKLKRRFIYINRIQSVKLLQKMMDSKEMKNGYSK